MKYGMRDSRCWVLSPAKVNLSLAVLGRRGDGYHALETVLARLSWCDRLECVATDSPHIDLHVQAQYPFGSWPAAAIPSDARNLVYRAALLLQQRYHVTRGVSIRLWKTIPPQAGLGGGSSNAAAALWGLNRVWELNLAQTELMGLASELGSDVPFFLSGAGYAQCTGRGEQVQPIDSAVRLWFVLAQSGGGLSTAAVYRAWQPEDSQPPTTSDVVAALQRGWTAGVIQQLRNDLQRPALRLMPELTRLFAAFTRLGITQPLMTGSGSVVYGVCDNYRQAQRWAARLRAWRLPGVWVAAAGV
ncbi:MAG: 4-diphosphocytidyl-2-C-methyl-D-erythritol kinase [Planctomycetaceae bacterium]|nr:MAG: 4-diphosphocytidyl-2-C-methyl-D-erythritol kinase [Planctomycetaceae bacterium]